MSDPTRPYRGASPDLSELASRSDRYRDEPAGRGDKYGLADLFRDPLEPGYAQAAARRAAGAGDPPSRWGLGTRAVTLVALVLLGVLLAVAYRHVLAEGPTRSQVRADLEEQVRDRTSDHDELQDQVSALQEEVADLRDQQLGDPARAQELWQLEAATGLVRVQGDGVVVRVDDGPSGVDPITGAPVRDPESQVLDMDLQRIVNGLWSAGAEAIAVNGRRLTVTSTIRGAGGVILVDRVPVAGPYQVAAIGPDDLVDRFTTSLAGQVMDALAQQHGIFYEVRRAQDLTLPAAAVPQLDHATSAGGER